MDRLRGPAFLPGFFLEASTGRHFDHVSVISYGDVPLY